MTPLRAGLRLLFALAVAAPAPAAAQVVYPPGPQKYDAHFRYRIRADRDQRIRQFREMERHLKAIGFAIAPREDADLDVFDPAAERMTGTIAAANAGKLLDDPRILTVVLAPTGTALDGNKPLQVRVTLATGLAPNEQRALHEQASRHLGLLGFREGIAYDHRGYATLRGTVPADSLLKLLDDLRGQPTGWFLPVIPPEQIHLPLRAVLPVRVVEVLQDLPAQAEAAPAPPPVGAAPASPKLTAEARAAVENPAAAGKPIRVDLVLQELAAGEWQGLRFRVRTAAEGVSVEGQVGGVVTVRVANAADVNKLAALPEVRSVRLPRAGLDAGDGPAAAWLGALTASRVQEVHDLGYRGQGVRVVVIGTEFGPVAELQKSLRPATPAVRLIDLTAELSSDVRPAGPSGRATFGTTAALAAHAAAPAAELVLVRVDPTAFHQLLAVARAVAGDPSFSEAMQSRSVELVSQADRLTVRRDVVAEEYRKALGDLSDDPKVADRRAAARKEFEKLIADETTFKGAAERFTDLKADLDRLRGAGVVVNTLVWDTGFPQDGLSELSRYLEQKFAPKPVRSALAAAKQPAVPVWVQPASPSVGQVWAGPFLDDDGNGVMEFAPRAAAPPAGRWTKELNFLTLTPGGGPVATRLPAGIKVRVTVQWREPHDPDGFLPREPAFPLTLRLLRQLDPEGKAAASDEFVEVGSSSDAAVRLMKTPGSGAFEQTLEVTVPVEGVYALRVEGRLAIDTSIPGQRSRAEIYPRVVVEAADAPTAARGRPTLATFQSDTTGVGIPGDSPAALTVGLKGAPTLTGAGPSVQLRTKPDVVVFGTNVGAAAGFAGGVAATLASAGVRAPDLIRTLGLEPGGELVLPRAWRASLRRP